MFFNIFSSSPYASFFFFFFNDTATTEIYTLSLHDALPIYYHDLHARLPAVRSEQSGSAGYRDRKSTRLNSSHLGISYAVFCLKKKQPSEPSRSTSSISCSNRATTNVTAASTMHNEARN